MNPPNRTSSILPHRPRTSSALPSDTPGPGAFEAESMKRTASQTFSPIQSALADLHEQRDRDMAATLGALSEGMSVEYPQASAPLASPISIARAGQSLKGSCKQICRRLSTSTSGSGSASASASASSSSDAAHRMQPQHMDSGVQTPTLGDDADSIAYARAVPVSRFPHLLRRFSSLRTYRRPATSGPAGDFPRFNPSPAPVPAHYPVPSPAPGHAARAAAHAANNERIYNSLRRQEEQSGAYLHAQLHSEAAFDDVLKDSESGVDMSCSSPVDDSDQDQEKKLDPIHYLPAELSTLVLSHLDAPSLARAESVSRTWQQAASSPHVWKSVFLRKFEPEVHVSPAPIMMGGAGIGKSKAGKPAPGQDWKNMYKVRMTINRRWKACSPSAIYLNGHTDSVYCCQFDEDKIITGSRDRTIRVWDMKTYKCKKVIGGPSNRPKPNTPAPLDMHRETVMSEPSMNGTAEGDLIYHVPADYHEASILCLQYDDRIMVTGSSDHTCIVWDITGDEYIPITRLENHTAGVLDVALDEKHIISCSKDATINVWNRQTFAHIRTLSGHRGPVNAVQLRGNLLVSASGDGVAKLWNLDSGVCIKEFSSQDRGLAAVEFSDDAKYVLAGGNDHVVYKFDAINGQLLHTSVKHGGLVRSLFLDAHNGRVISGSYDQSIRVADYTTGEVYGLYDNWTTSWILSAKSDYRRVVATSQDGRALILDFGWNTEDKEQLVGDSRV